MALLHAASRALFDRWEYPPRYVRDKAKCAALLEHSPTESGSAVAVAMPPTTRASSVESSSWTITVPSMDYTFHRYSNVAVIAVVCVCECVERVEG